MKKLVMLALALVLFIPGTARAGTGPSGYLVVTTTCEEDADQPGTFDLRSHVDMWTNREKYKRMIVIYTEYRDYGDGWLLSRETWDVAYRSSGEIIDGFFHTVGSYHARFDPTNYDVRLGYSFWWRAPHEFVNQYGTIAKKRDGGRCFASSYDEAPPGF